MSTPGLLVPWSSRALAASISTSTTEILTVTKLSSHFKRALFLDFDGVLHSIKTVQGAKPPMTPAQIRTAWPRAFEYTGRLAKLLGGHEDVAVVVSSSWRMYLDDDELHELLPELTKWFVGSVGQPYRNRDVAVRHWLATHSQVHSFVVLDDQPGFYPGDEWRDSLIACAPQIGIDDPDVIWRLSSWLEGSRPLLKRYPSWH